MHSTTLPVGPALGTYISHVLIDRYWYGTLNMEYTWLATGARLPYVVLPQHTAPSYCTHAQACLWQRSSTCGQSSSALTYNIFICYEPSILFPYHFYRPHISDTSSRSLAGLPRELKPIQNTIRPLTDRTSANRVCTLLYPRLHPCELAPGVKGPAATSWFIHRWSWIWLIS